MDAVVLAGIVKRLYPNFNMSSFDDRFKIQKMIYLMKAFNLELGYDFSLYLRGPYCATLTRDAFIIKDWDKAPLMKFDDSMQESQFTKFLEAITPHKNDTDWLEVASTLLLIKQNNKSFNDTKVILECKNIKSEHSQLKITDILNEMKESGFYV